MSKFLSACMVVATATACAKQAPPASSPEPGAAPQAQKVAVNRNRDVISQEELQAPSIAGLTVLEAVKSLRPQFLTERGSYNFNKGQGDEEAGKVHASIDGSKIVVVEELSGIRASTIKEVRYLSPAAAMQKFGGAAREGPVILVTTM
jgi:hypothetical protein